MQSATDLELPDEDELLNEQLAFENANNRVNASGFGGGGGDSSAVHHASSLHLASGLPPQVPTTLSTTRSSKASSSSKGVPGKLTVQGLMEGGYEAEIGNEENAAAALR